ncbi:hypothetical protein KIN20_022769 [Parelaphostrongylus tenuis]|uniref:Uncharacterized protein n=1 Tax=Parelaphostrongylus tenuis TaxID=148309 RepID=A0AAD5MQR0_PARTN|nr:hypothetical protein KIN20_022769 [Parelaphostrongylus tenuis]
MVRFWSRDGFGISARKGSVTATMASWNDVYRSLPATNRRSVGAIASDRASSANDMKGRERATMASQNDVYRYLHPAPCNE